MALIKKWWWLAIPAVALLAVGVCSDIRDQIQDSRDQKKIVELESQLAAAKFESSLIEHQLGQTQEELQHMIDNPITTEIVKYETKVVVKKIDGKEYVPITEYNAVVANRDDLYNLCEQFRGENEKLRSKIAEHLAQEGLFRRVQKEIVANLESQVTLHKNVAVRLRKRLRRKWGVGFVGGYGFNFNDVTKPNWFIGVGIYYKIY